MVNEAMVNLEENETEMSIKSVKVMHIKTDNVAKLGFMVFLRHLFVVYGSIAKTLTLSS